MYFVDAVFPHIRPAVITFFNCLLFKVNLNKSEKLVTNTTAASKYIPKRPRICIIGNPPFQTQIYLLKVPLNVSIVK